MIKTFADRDTPLMFEIHDQTGSYFTNSSNPSLSQLIKFYKDLGLKYKDTQYAPYIWFNVQNEPGGSGAASSQWLTTHGEVLKSLREAGLNNIVVCDGASWGQDAGSWGSGNVEEKNSAILTYGQQLLNYGGKKYDNVIFSFHAYEQWNGGDNRVEDYYKRIQAKGLCVVCGEYSGSNNKQDTMPASRSIMKMSQKYNVGRIMWSWDGGNEGDLLNLPNNRGGWNIDKKDGSKPSNLNELGNMCWEDNRRTEKLATLSSSKPISPPNPPSDNINFVASNLKVQEPLWRKSSSIHFQVDIKNLGLNSSPPNTWVGVGFLVDGVQMDWGGTNESFAAGETKTIVSQGWSATKSCFSLTAKIDDQSKVTETNETDNTLSVTLD